jgi:hypothetical protein
LLKLCGGSDAHQMLNVFLASLKLDGTEYLALVKDLEGSDSIPSGLRQ